MISVVLLEPQISGNIGAVCRCMKNFGVEKLVIIEPKCNHLELDAKSRARKGITILQNARVVKKSYLKNFDYIIGTTSALGTDYNIPRSSIRPEQLSELISGVKGNIAILFGRESIGLTNEEILICDFIVTIPAAKKYPSLNLSHAVAIILYEIFKKVSKKKQDTHFKYSSKKEKQLILGYLDKILNQMEFQTIQKKETQKKVWKRMIGKSFLTKREAYALIGFLKKLTKL